MADAHPNLENLAPPDVREEGRWPVVLDAEAAYEAIRSINHRTIWLSEGLPASAVYWVLAELKSALGYSAQQALEQLGRGLAHRCCHSGVVGWQRRASFAPWVKTRSVSRWPTRPCSSLLHGQEPREGSSR